MNRMAHRWLRRPWFAPLLLVTLVARGLMPTGFMPGPQGIMLCPGYAPLLSASHADDAAMDNMSGMPMDGMDMAHMDGASRGHHGSEPPPHDGMGVCPYAGAASGIGLLHAPHVTVLPEQLAAAVVTLPPEQIVPRAPIAPNRLPRGPPRLS